MTQDVTILEAVAWRWLQASGVLEDDPKDDVASAVAADDAAKSPHLLIKLLSEFKRQFNLWNVKPRNCVDTLALAQGWWTKDSEVRCDAFVFAFVEELFENEWTPLVEVLNNVEDITEEQATASLERMTNNGSTVKVPNGVTTPRFTRVAR